MRTFTALLGAAAIPMMAAGQSDTTTDAGLFEAPVEITAGGSPISDLLYPSPVLYDLNGDGVRELVLGDLPGYLYSCEAEQSGDDLRWGARQNIKADGKPLKLHNW